MENPIQLDDLGGTIILGNTHILPGESRNIIKLKSAWKDGIS